MPASTDEILPPSADSHLQMNRTDGGNRAFHNFYNDYSHIPDPNLRRRLALSEIDKVPFGFHHVRAILVAGAGFFIDSYDIFAINLTVALLGMVFWGGGDPEDGYGGNRGHLPDPINQALKAATSGGIIIGMIIFGWLADAFGRRKMYGIELIIIIFGTFSCSLVSSSPAISSAALLVFWRVIMGIGIGGDYPLSSVITSEFAPTRWRGAMVGAVFSMQGLGQLTAAVVALIVAAGFRGSYINITDASLCDFDCRVAADRSWRIIVGVGVVPACIALYYRITIPETPRYTFDVQLDVEKADADIRAYVSSGNAKTINDDGGISQTRIRPLSTQTLNVPRASWGDLVSYFSEWKHLQVLIGTSMSWFFLDLAFYGLTLNNTIILQAIGYGHGKTLYDTLYNQAVGMIIITCAGGLPGYWFAVFIVDTVGRKPLQLLGFLLLAIVFCILGFLHDSLSEPAMLGLYIVAMFLFNAGPNTTTFLVAGECFPTRYRSTAHGISAAMGKLGAVIAQIISIPLLRTPAKDDGCVGRACTPTLDRLLQLFALFMLFGLLMSLLIPETKGLTLEELSGETRTSYNAGCNGSISLSSEKRRSWNPFRGGRPAGFLYPRDELGLVTSSASDNTRGRMSPSPSRARASTTASVSSQQQSHQRGRSYKNRLFWRRRRRTRAYSDETDDIALSSRGSAGLQQQQQPDSAVQEPGPLDRHLETHVPTWGAGWGRIDRGRRVVSMQDVHLHDVGALLNTETTKSTTDGDMIP